MIPTKSPRRILAVAALAAILASAAVAPSAAQTNGDNRDEMEIEDEERRLRTRIEDDRARIDIQQNRGDAEDHARIQFDSDDAELRVSFETEDEGREAERQLEATFHRVIEFEDGDDDGTFDRGERIASSWLLARDADAEVEGGPVNGTVSWDRLQIQRATSDDDVPGAQIRGRADLGGQGTFGLDLKAFGKMAETNGTRIDAGEAKIDIVIDGYPFAEDDTKVAVVVTVKAETEFEEGGQAVSDPGEVGVSAREVLGDRVVEMTFTWKDTAQADGDDTSVGSTIFSTEREVDQQGYEVEDKKTIALAYARGDRIVHDPVAGVATFQGSGGAGGGAGGAADIPTAGVLAAAVAAAAAALARRRR